MNFEQKIKNFKKLHLVIFVIFSLIMFTVWSLKEFGKILPAFEAFQSIVILQYAAIFITFGGIVFGYYFYGKEQNKFKENALETIKQESFYFSKKVQNIIIYAVFCFDILLFVLTAEKQFALFSAVTLIICAVNFPTFGKYKRDYFDEDDDSSQEGPLEN
ncbi:MAG: hypothetical protein IKR41_12725 [Bacteroidales bacterium]|nr:hypothetical protein [Bacteroidales bacterium]